ncbi:hypothetical protein CHUAL_004077 [Chamberlinius hualienensis]
MKENTGTPKIMKENNETPNVRRKSSSGRSGERKSVGRSSSVRSTTKKSIDRSPCNGKLRANSPRHSKMTSAKLSRRSPRRQTVKGQSVGLRKSSSGYAI